MTRREKIILVLMALSVVYGFYALFIENPNTARYAGGSSESKLEAFNNFISNVADMTRDGLSEIDSYVIEHIPAKWTKDPLLNTRGNAKISNEPAVTTASAQQLGITYSGFLQMGDKSLAIINGLEYETGERLREGNHLVGSIYPNRVIILIRDGRTKLTVPLEETQ
jgi:hypothetical protein